MPNLNNRKKIDWKKKTHKKNSVWVICGMITKDPALVSWESQRRGGSVELKKISNKQWQEKSPNLAKGKTYRFKKWKKFQAKISLNKSTLSWITVNFLKLKTKNKVLKEVREKQCITYKIIQMTTISHLKPRKPEINGTFYKFWKKRIVNSEFYTQQNYSYQTWVWFWCLLNLFKLWGFCFVLLLFLPFSMSCNCFSDSQTWWNR